MAVVATSLKLPKGLKARIARIARRRGETSHAAMLRMLQERVEDAERFERLVEEAREADREIDATGQVFLAGDVHAYLESRVRGQEVQRPAPVQWRK